MIELHIKLSLEKPISSEKLESLTLLLLNDSILEIKQEVVDWIKQFVVEFYLKCQLWA